MQDFLTAVGCDAAAAAALGDDVRQRGQAVFQPRHLPAVRQLELGSDLSLGAREAGGPAWPVATTRWRTDYHLQRLSALPGGHLLATGLWEPVAGATPVRTSLHVTTLSDQRPIPAQPGAYASYLALLADRVQERRDPVAELLPTTGPTAQITGQCRLTVRGRVADLHETQPDPACGPVRMLWITSPGSWAILAAAPASACHGDISRGTWVEVSGILQGELVASAR